MNTNAQIISYLLKWIQLDKGLTINFKLFTVHTWLNESAYLEILFDCIVCNNSYHVFVYICHAQLFVTNRDFCVPVWVIIDE